VRPLRHRLGIIPIYLVNEVFKSAVKWLHVVRFE
jgi:hypothetical protein